MKKRGIVIFVLAAVLLLALIAFLFFIRPPRFSEEQILNDPAAAMEACTKVSGENQVNCYLKVAEVLNTTDIDLAFQACSAIDDEGKQNSFEKECIDGLIKAQSETDTKVSICKKIISEGWKKNCIEGLANKETDQSKAVAICNEITDDNNFRQHCYGTIMANFQNVSNDVKLAMCESNTGTQKDNCYRGIAEEFLVANPQKSVEICNKISDRGSRENCLENILSNPEIVKANSVLAVSICSSVALKDRCYNNVARTLSGKDPKEAAEVCKKLSDDVQISDCYNGLWFEFSDLVIANYDFTISLCNALILKRDDCFRKAAGEFVNSDKDKAEALCRMMSASNSPGCLQDISRGQ